MPHQPKIATCCYCGTRAALVLTGQVRHELACASCGAPLHDLKMLRSDARGDRELVKPSRFRGAPTYRKQKKKKRKKGRSLGQRFMNDVLDFELDDILDDLFDILD